MKRLAINIKTEIVTPDCVFSSGQHRKVIIILTPGRLIGFRLEGESTVYWLTSAMCFDNAVKHQGRIDLRSAIDDGQGRPSAPADEPFLPFES